MRDLSRSVHPPAISHDGFASLATATYRASTIVYPDPQAFAERKHRGPDGYTYGLHGTPTTRTLEAQLTALHQGVRTVLAPSGQAAIALVFLTVLKPGDRVLIPDSVYGPVKGFCANYLAPRGIRHTVYDPAVGAGIVDLLDDDVRLVWVESPGSNTMEVQDLPAIVAAAHRRGVLVGCDNTWASPLLHKPLALGADFAMEALTKYVGGHSDLLLGSVTVGDIQQHRALKDTLRMLGVGVSPDDATLALRGLETMGVRIAHMGRVALALVGEFADHAAIDRILYPALPGSPGHDLWKRDFAGASGLFSVVLRPGSEERLMAALSDLEVFAIGASWGGTCSLIAPQYPAGERSVVPYSSGVMLRVSIGLEDPDDLRADLRRVFDALAAD